MGDLPFVDEYVRATAAPRDAVWSTLLAAMGRPTRAGAGLARLLGCDPDARTATFDGRPGDAVPGFRVVEADPGRRLVLRGRHRFAAYSLAFVLEDDGLHAVTRAAFPGVRGRVYRALVIGSGAHRAVTRRMLRRVTAAAGRRAERT